MGASDAPVSEETGEGAPRSPHPRTRDGKAVHGVHPKLKEKYPISATEVAKPESARTNSFARVTDKIQSVAWCTSNEAVLNKAQELGIEPRRGESYDALTIRVHKALDTWQSSRKKA